MKMRSWVKFSHCSILTEPREEAGRKGVLSQHWQVVQVADPSLPTWRTGDRDEVYKDSAPGPACVAGGYWVKFGSHLQALPGVGQCSKTACSLWWKECLHFTAMGGPRQWSWASELSCQMSQQLW